MSTTTPPAPETVEPVAADVVAQAALDAECAELTRRMEKRKGETEEERLLRRAEVISEACGTDPMTGEPYYSTAEVLSWIDRAVNEMGAARPKLGPGLAQKLFRAEVIPNARLREAFERLSAEHGITAGQLALAIGEVRRGGMAAGQGDASRVERLLGISHLTQRGVKHVRLFITYEMAVKIADALHLNYHDLGL